MRKAVKKLEKLTALKDATLADLAAKRRLREARLSGDAERIGAALDDSRATAAAVAALHTRRFEKNAAMRGTTALSAIGELSKLARQQRYAVTGAHVMAIVEPLRAAVDELQEALKEAQRRNGSPARGAITFDAAAAGASAARA